MIENYTSVSSIGSTIHVLFEKPMDNIFFIIKATGQEAKINAVNGELRLIKGRVYYIPIDNKEINSDDFNILKIFSSIADKLSVTFVKEGFACVIPIIHNCLIKNGQQLCVIHN